MDLTKQAIEKEFELKQKEKRTNHIKDEGLVKSIPNESTLKYITEPFVYVVIDLIWKSENELNKIFNQYFPKTKDMLLEIINGAKENLINILMRKQHTNIKKAEHLLLFQNTLPPLYALD